MPKLHSFPQVMVKWLAWSALGSASQIKALKVANQTSPMRSCTCRFCPSIPRLHAAMRLMALYALKSSHSSLHMMFIAACAQACRSYLFASALGKSDAQLAYIQRQQAIHLHALNLAIVMPQFRSSYLGVVPLQALIAETCTTMSSQCCKLKTSYLGVVPIAGADS